MVQFDFVTMPPPPGIPPGIFIFFFFLGDNKSPKTIGLKTMVNISLPPPRLRPLKLLEGNRSSVNTELFSLEFSA